MGCDGILSLIGAILCGIFRHSEQPSYILLLYLHIWLDATETYSVSLFTLSLTCPAREREEKKL